MRSVVKGTDEGGISKSPEKIAEGQLPELLTLDVHNELLTYQPHPENGTIARSRNFMPRDLEIITHSLFGLKVLSMFLNIYRKCRIYIKPFRIYIQMFRINI